MQDRKKFRGNDETGLINVQCRHVYILVSVDMFLGERYVVPSSDCAKAHKSFLPDTHTSIMQLTELLKLATSRR